MDDVRRTIAKAADIIETTGWIQNRMISENGCCAFKALRLAARELFPIPSKEATVVFDARALVAHHVESAVVNWNDKADQTKDNVISTLRKIAAT